MAGRALRGRTAKVFVADGDALIMDLAMWEPILEALPRALGPLRRVSCYAMASNVLEKTPEDLARLRERGLTRLYIGPESGDPVTLKRIAKGATFEDHVRAAERAHAAGMEISMIALLGAGGTERAAEHAEATAELVTAMDPEFFAALTLTVVPDTPQATLEERGRSRCPRSRGCSPSCGPSLRRRPRQTRCSAPTTPATTCRWPADCPETESASWRCSTSPSPGRSRCEAKHPGVVGHAVRNCARRL